MLDLASFRIALEGYWLMPGSTGQATVSEFGANCDSLLERVALTRLAAGPGAPTGAECSSIACEISDGIRIVLQAPDCMA